MKMQLLAVFLSAALGIAAFAADDAAPANGAQVKQINYSYKGTRYLLQMSFDAKALAALAANPVAADEMGESLVEDMEQRGGVLQDVKRGDGTLVPSEQQFSERTGKRTAAIYRRAGLRQNPAPDVAAVQGWD